MTGSKWPKRFPPLTAEQQIISDDFMKHWHTVLPAKYGLVNRFNHLYPLRHAQPSFVRTLEVGAGDGEHLQYEKLSGEQSQNYHAIDIRQNMIAAFRSRFPNIAATVADCQQRLPFDDHYFDRILAIHVLEHLPNLPAAVAELHRVCNKEHGLLSVVIPCEGGFAYGLARRMSAQRVFENRYKQPYRWFIEREHVNKPNEIIEELQRYFHVRHSEYWPLMIPVTSANLCIGMTLAPS